MVKPLLPKAVAEMNSSKLSEIIKVKSRFGRSVNLERDFYNRVSLDGYVLTTTSRHALGRMVEAFFNETAARAWTLTGPYGSGKSTFALFAAKVLDYKSPAESWQARNLVKEKDHELWRKLFESEDSLFNQDNSSPRLFPILISGAFSNFY
jgi:ABC-type molybdenum transport system ATPase subunit/photorepair protein PhrA